MCQQSFATRFSILLLGKHATENAGSIAGAERNPRVNSVLRLHLTTHFVTPCQTRIPLRRTPLQREPLPKGELSHPAVECCIHQKMGTVTSCLHHEVDHLTGRAVSQPVNICTSQHRSNGKADTPKVLLRAVLSNTCLSRRCVHSTCALHLWLRLRHAEQT